MNMADRDAAITGILFILAAVTSLIASKLYDPLLFSADLLRQAYNHGDRLVVGAIFELLLTVSVVGTAIMLYPWFKKQNEGLAVGYVCFRLLEAVLVAVGLLGLLSLLILSQEYIRSTEPDMAYFEAAGSLLNVIHSRTFILGPTFMLGLNTALCSYLLYKSMLVPRFITVMGLTAAIFSLYAALLEMFSIIYQNSAWAVALAMPVFVYQITLALWLIYRGFNPLTTQKQDIAWQT